MTSAQTIAELQSFEGVATATPAQPRLLELRAEAFAGHFDRQPFVIGHHLANHPLFSLEQLVALSRRLPAEQVRYNTGRVEVGTGVYRGPQNGLSVEETIRQIEACESWMVLKFVEHDPAYRELLDRCLDEVQCLSEPVRPGMSRREAFIFISSPGAVTPYHLDPEHNFLLQIRGRKRVHIWNRDDRQVLSEEELEGFLASRQTQIEFREEYQARAATFELTPGTGLHFPVAAPHWVQNGDEVSVSFSITFRSRSSERRVIVSQANAQLRELGLKPAPFGRSALRDAAKYHAFRAWRRMRRLA
ncbi:MAG TPA: cupin-like domain-containing protein [Blastocatellia bacterium]|nr:cupin-like domain-containing protein [Blastocatellia bacterium]